MTQIIVLEMRPAWTNHLSLCGSPGFRVLELLNAPAQCHRRLSGDDTGGGLPPVAYHDDWND